MTAELLARGGRKLALGDMNVVVFYDFKSLVFFESESGTTMAQVLEANFSVSPLADMLRAGLLHDQEYTREEMEKILEDVFEEYGIGALRGIWQVIAIALLKNLPNEEVEASEDEKKPTNPESGFESSGSESENSDSPQENSGA